MVSKRAVSISKNELAEMIIKNFKINLGKGFSKVQSLNMAIGSLEGDLYFYPNSEVTK